LLLHADNLTVERGSRAVISHLSFTVRAGEALLVVGPNGAGKTTLIRTLAGFIAPSQGLITLKGDTADQDRDDGDIADLCHYVGHLTGVKAALTAAENLAFWARYLGADDLGADDLGADGGTLLRERVDAALARFGLLALADFPAGLLSAGQKRRLGLARLGVARRPIWLLDEPTVSLDATSTDLLAGLIEAHLRARGIVIAATHLPLGLDQPAYLRLGPQAAGDTLIGEAGL